MKKIRTDEGNRAIAKFLGFVYVSSKNEAHERPQGITYGYWKNTFPNAKTLMEGLSTLSQDGFKPVLHRPKLEFDTDWGMLMKVVSKAERLTDYEVTFDIGRDRCVVMVRNPETKQVLFTHVATYSTKVSEKQAGVWECTALFCKLYNGDLYPYLSNTR